ncbi:MAG TPA: hypothetical protein VIG68_00365 [Lysobacter sp.]
MTAKNHTSIPAIAVGRGYTVLGAMRSLAMAGIPTYVACPPGEAVTRSRWYRPTPGATPWNGGLGPHGLEVLRQMPFEQAVIIPCADDAALWAAGLAGSDLASRFKVSTSSLSTLDILQDKRRCGEFLLQHDIPHPRTFTIDSLADIAQVPFHELDRVFVKPADSQSFSQAFGAKGVWASSRTEFEELWRRLDDGGFKVVAQEYVPGRSSDHYFVDGFRDRNGTLSGLFARRRLRLFPLDFGNSSYSHSIPLEDVRGAIEPLTRLLAELQYRGIFSAEFKRDSRNGQFKLIEVNTRAWWYVEFAARCGVNVCRMAYEDAQDITPTPAPRRYPVNVGCVNLRADVSAMRAVPADSRAPWRRVLGQWARAYFHVFRWDDPVPGLHELGRTIGGKLRRIGSGIQAVFSGISTTRG